MVGFPDLAPTNPRAATVWITSKNVDYVELVINGYQVGPVLTNPVSLESVIIDISTRLTLGYNWIEAWGCDSVGNCGFDAALVKRTDYPETGSGQVSYTYLSGDTYVMQFATHTFVQNFYLTTYDITVNGGASRTEARMSSSALSAEPAVKLPYFDGSVTVDGLYYWPFNEYWTLGFCYQMTLCSSNCVQKCGDPRAFGSYLTAVGRVSNFKMLEGPTIGPSGSAQAINVTGS
jgi:hypothetical protein